MSGKFSTGGVGTAELTNLRHKNAVVAVAGFCIAAIDLGGNEDLKTPRAREDSNHF